MGKREPNPMGIASNLTGFGRIHVGIAQTRVESKPKRALSRQCLRRAACGELWKFAFSQFMRIWSVLTPKEGDRGGDGIPKRYANITLRQAGLLTRAPRNTHKSCQD